ncbi:recombinase family protein [Polaribacter sp. Hel1_85]|uniref:recombinase family protein n=1 Tax=Polaribacter sp. Hel1_85 TaxID=1250005 RepID=UPI00052BD12F|nr:site-specific recombinase [Polaribacter sp. Hel1_85]
MKNLKGKSVILYTRVSTTEQKENGHSLDQQEILLKNFCSKNEIKIIKQYEEDYSGKNFQRPEFKKLVEFSKKNKVDLILCYNWSRFSRNVFSSYQVIGEFMDRGIEINTMTQWINFKDPTQYNMLGLFLSQPYVSNLIRSNDTKKGINGALRSGRLTSRAPIGYYNDKGLNKTKKPLIQLCPEKSPLIKLIFEKYATGNYTQEILRKEFVKKGINRSKSQFSNMLSNIIYMGKVFVPEYEELPAEIITGQHQGIVDELTFHKVQQVKLNRANCRINAKKNSKHEEQLPLRGGILKCAKCNSNLTGSPSKSRNGNHHYYYHCNSRKGCKERFKVEIAHNELNKILIALEPQKEVLELFKEILIDKYKSSKSNKINILKKLQRQKKQIEDRLDNLTEKFVEGIIDKGSYNRLRNDYNNQINDLTLNIDEHSNYQKDIRIYVDFGIQFLTSINVFYKKANTEIKRKIIGSIFSEKLVFENKKYRTAKFNDVIALIFNSNKGLSSVENKKRHEISNVSYLVAGTGLEPVTFGL